MFDMALIFLLSFFLLKTKSIFVKPPPQPFDNHPQRVKWQQALQWFNALYAGINTYHIAEDAKAASAVEDDNYIYGEIDCQSFVQVLEGLTPQPTELFYDLGSGAGKAVFAAALFFDLRAKGVEILSGLHQFATLQRERCLQYSAESEIEFIEADLLQHDFLSADIIFINATCFHYRLWVKLLERIKQLKKGSRLLIISKKILDSSFQLIREDMMMMSWGFAGFRVYIKVH
jgi:SAM-dependent methyltransferase